MPYVGSGIHFLTCTRNTFDGTLVGKIRCMAVILMTNSLICNSVVVGITAPTAQSALPPKMSVRQWNCDGKWDTIYGCNSKDQYMYL